MPAPHKHRHADQSLSAPAPSGRPNHIQPAHLASGAMHGSATHPLSRPGAAVPHGHSALKRAGQATPMPRHHREAVVHPASAQELMERHRE
jgi:hypothetical protein